MTAVAENDLQRRRAKLRERELLLALEQWAGDDLEHVFTITTATEEEQAWLRRQTVPQPARTAEELLAIGRRANAEAGTAFLAGDYDRARELIDDARAHGALFDAEWVRLHEFIATRAAIKPA